MGKSAQDLRRAKATASENMDLNEMKAASDVFFREALAKLHPQLRHAQDLEPDGELEREVRKRLLPSRRLNALLMTSPDQPYRVGAAFEVESIPGIPKTQTMHSKLYTKGPVYTGQETAPQTVIVTGHNGGGGNACVNGIYTLCPGEH